MPKSKTPSFVTEIPLIVTAAQNRELEARFRAGQQLYNAVLSEALVRLKLVRNSENYLEAKKLKGEENKAKRKNLYEKAKKENRFTDFSLQDFATLTAKRSVWIWSKLDSHTVQTLGTRAFKAVGRLLYGKAKKVRFKTFSRFKSIEGKTNKQGIMWNNKNNELFVSWSKLKLLPIINRLDPVICHGLNSKIKYCRLVFRYLNGNKRWFLQLINEGLPFQKPKNKINEGLVGLDLNISNVGFVADKKAGLLPFAEKAPDFDKQIKKLQRKLERSRRASNPDNYQENSEKKVGKKLVIKKGKIKSGRLYWVNSKTYNRTRTKYAELNRKKSSYVKSVNRKQVNEILRHGNRIRTEKVSIKAWQKNYGKAILRKSPGFFQSELKRKAESSGGSFLFFSTRTTALSQTHLDGSREKKSLSERTHQDKTGIVMHRDIFSAYLARFVDEESWLDIRSAKESYAEFSEVLEKGWGDFKNN